MTIDQMLEIIQRMPGRSPVAPTAGQRAVNGQPGVSNKPPELRLANSQPTESATRCQREDVDPV